MTEATQRLFFALWPDPSTSDALTMLARQVAAESGGRPTAPGNAHVTLAFLGDQSRLVARELSAGASRISAPAFDLVFDRVGGWRKSHRLGGRAKRTLRCWICIRLLTVCCRRAVCSRRSGPWRFM
jgi:hypothetical protein